MITQYTRLIVDKSDNSIAHCTSQDFPFADGWEPVEYDTKFMAAYDFELDTDFPDADFGIGVSQQMIRAREIIDNFEMVGGVPQLKTGADVGVSTKALRISATKSIQETDIKAEMAIDIKAMLNSGGLSEKELLDDMRLLDPLTPTRLEDLRTLQTIRMKKALSANK